MTARLAVDGLRGGYGPAPVIFDIDLEVGGSEIVGLFGSNGAGKTTVLRGISGTLPVCCGEVRVDDTVVSRRKPWRRVRAGMAHVPEGRHIFGAMTVRENLQVAALVRHRRADVDRVYGIFPRLAERRSQLAGNLSGGEQQMLAIGRALMTEPGVLLIDEMSAGLAPFVVSQLVDTLMALRDSGIAVLLVEQSPNLVARAVDRVYLLDHGRLVGSGTLEELGGVERLAEVYLGVA